jgi:adenosylcobinamide kinase/adenosylcobinamide-phosphate guanylyltransferase
MAEFILITGGARSGKSSYALEVAEGISARKLFVATCPNIDLEMSQRVIRHQHERDGRGWQTVEVETDLAALFPDKTKDFDVVLIDCITLWVNNILHQASQQDRVIDDFQIRDLCFKWLQGAKDYNGTVICVTNEVGLGIVPDNALARHYRDLVGTCNQTIGKKADKVILVSCGIPLHLKK